MLNLPTFTGLLDPHIDSDAAHGWFVRVPMPRVFYPGGQTHMIVQWSWVEDLDKLYR